MSVFPSSPEQASLCIIVHCGGYLWKITDWDLQLGFDCLSGSVINRARLSVNCKLLSLNLWMVLTRCTESMVKVFQHHVCILESMVKVFQHHVCILESMVKVFQHHVCILESMVKVFQHHCLHSWEYGQGLPTPCLHSWEYGQGLPTPCRKSKSAFLREVMYLISRVMSHIIV